MRTTLPWTAALLLMLSACADTPPGPAIRALPAEASLDARSLERGRAAERPAAVQRREAADGSGTFLTVSPRLQTGSPGSLPMIVTSLGAERERASGTVRPSALVIVSNARGYGGFSRAESRQAGGIALRVLGRSTDCQNAGACLYTETILLTFSEADLRKLSEGAAAMRIRLTGNASFVEAAIPSGHLRALAAALAQPPSGSDATARPL